MASQGKANGKKGKILLISMIGIGLILLQFGLIWLQFIWPKMIMIPTNMDKHYWQQGVFQIMDQKTGNFTRLEVKDDIHITSGEVLGGTIFLHKHHQFYSNSTGEKLPYAKEQILAVDRKTGRIDAALMQYAVGQAAEGYQGFPPGLKEGMTVNVFCPGTVSIRLATVVRNDVYHFQDRDFKIVVMRQEYTDVPTSVPGFPPGVTITGYTNYFVEQKTGLVLDAYADEALSVPINGQKVVVFKNQIWYDPSMTEKMIDSLDKINTMFPLMGKVMPWTCIGLGMVLMVGGGGVLFLKSRKRKVAVGT